MLKEIRDLVIVNDGRRIYTHFSLQSNERDFGVWGQMWQNNNLVLGEQYSLFILNQ